MRSISMFTLRVMLNLWRKDLAIDCLKWIKVLKEEKCGFTHSGSKLDKNIMQAFELYVLSIGQESKIIIKVGGNQQNHFF